MCIAYGTRCQGALAWKLTEIELTWQVLGDKTSARALAEECGVPVVPGSSKATASAKEALAVIEELQIGFPVILKAGA